MNRVLPILVSLALVSSGCITEEVDREFGGGSILSKTVDDPPDDAEVVQASHPSIQDVGPVQEAVDRAIENEGEWTRVNVSGGEMDAVSESLRSLPQYRGNGETGYYVSSGDHVVVLRAARNVSTST